MSIFESRELRIFLGFAIGLLIGSERERRRNERGYSTFAGIRTFGLIGLLGALLGYLDNSALLTVGAAGISLLVLVAYVVNREDPDRGVTTEVAMLVTYVLGVLAESEPAVAASAGVVVTLVLSLRGPLHKAVREAVSEAELRALLLFLVFALVLLPLMPDVHMGPYGAIHPPSLMRLVTLLMFIHGLGHVAQRVLGPRFGLAVAGLAGGFVSSSATIATMSLRAKVNPAGYQAAVAGALASCVATSVQYLLIVAAIDPPLLQTIALPLSVSLLVATLASGSFAVSAARASAPSGTDAGKPFSLTAGLVFVGVYCGVTMLASALHERLGGAGIALVSAAAGFVDAHSTAGSIASLHLAGDVESEAALLASLSALSANSATKLVLAWSGRNLRFGLWTTCGILLIIASAWLTLLVR